MRGDSLVKITPKIISKKYLAGLEDDKENF